MFESGALGLRGGAQCANQSVCVPSVSNCQLLLVTGEAGGCKGGQVTPFQKVCDFFFFFFYVVSYFFMRCLDLFRD